MQKQFLFTISLLLAAVCTWGQLPPWNDNIKIDDFGYLPNSNKVAVIANPRIGYNAAESLSPSTGAGMYQVRRRSDNAIMFSGTIRAWKNGAIHSQSGDQGWWFDFSAFKLPGEYYIYDVGRNIRSFFFRIGEDVYNAPLRAALRMFYYQRLNIAKVAPFAQAPWIDNGVSAPQEANTTSRFAKGVASTARDLRGGWMDAGDVNKYTTFAEFPVIQLAETYRNNPSIFGDNNSIPESGNGIPDILDELKYELDFLKRMQDGTRTNGFLLKVGVDNFNNVSPISADTRPRYYLPECTSATLSGAAMFAAAGQAFKNHPSLAAYGHDLIVRAERAWARAKITTNNFTTFQANCDDLNIKAGDADKTVDEQLRSTFVAAAYLFEATGKNEYRSYVDSKYTTVQPYKNFWWGPYFTTTHFALLRYMNTPGANATVATNIRNRKMSTQVFSLEDYTNMEDLYRAYMPDAQHHWGSNQIRANVGNMNMDFISYRVTNSGLNWYREVAEQYLHWLHGVNPRTQVMLSNMEDLGAARSVPQIYHYWFADGTVWDDVRNSNGPPPGFVVGGPNKGYSGTQPTLSWVVQDQPVQKAYVSTNRSDPEKSYELTEPSIYNQAAYVMLVSRIINATNTPPTVRLTAPTANATYTAPGRVTLTATAADPGGSIASVRFYRNGVLVATDNSSPYTFTWSNVAAGTYTITALATDNQGVSTSSNGVTITVRSSSREDASEEVATEATAQLGVVEAESAELPEVGKVYPSPTATSFRFVAPKAVRTLRVIDLSGKVFIERSDIPAHQEEVFGEQLPDGLYIVDALFEDRKKHQFKVVKQK